MASLYIRSRSGASAYRRAGLVFTPQWELFENLSKEQLEKLRNDPHLQVRKDRPGALAADSDGTKTEEPAGKPATPVISDEDLKDLLTTVEDLERKVDSLRSDNANLEAEKAALTGRLDRATAENKALTAKLAALEAASKAVPSAPAATETTPATAVTPSADPGKGPKAKA